MGITGKLCVEMAACQGAAAIVTVFSGKFSGCGRFYCSNKENIPEPENPPGKLGAVDLRGTRMSVVVGTIGT
jgi:hypothetical protein